ncbi:MAG TPA: rhodanese [Rhodospirillaceae bacterium]|nr:rhodanese [Rhodospirillaceae bacterium]|tara:strand:+ start:260 stop:655 length:396 start_codon:yes stop_codon:yes gene_type:complete
MISKGVKQLVQEANATVETVPADGADKLIEDESIQLVDIRDVRELERDGLIPGAFHAPRGMLEFWVDPDSPYHKEIFASGKKFVFYCASAWRSALATKAVQEMGLSPVAHLEGGFGKWKENGYPIGERKKK